VQQFVTLLVPHIASQWKIVADYLKCEAHTVQLISCVSSDPAQCCMEMLNHWFYYDHDHSWTKVMITLKQIKGLKNIDKIEKEIAASRAYVIAHVAWNMIITLISFLVYY